MASNKDKPTTEQGESKPKRGGNNAQWNNTEPNTNAGDNAKYLTHNLAIFKQPKIDTSNPQAVGERIEWYFKLCQDNDMKPNVAALSLALGIDRRRLWEIVSTKQSTHGVVNDTSPESRDIIKKTYAIMNAMLEDYSLHGKLNPVTAIFLAKNHFGYQDRQDIALDDKRDPLGESKSAEQLAAEYADK